MRLAYSCFLLDGAVQSSWNLLMNQTYYLLVIYVVQGACYGDVYQQIDTYAQTCTQVLYRPFVMWTEK